MRTERLFEHETLRKLRRLSSYACRTEDVLDQSKCFAAGVEAWLKYIWVLFN